MEGSHQSSQNIGKSTAENIIKILLDKQHRKYDSNVISKLNEFLLKFTLELIEESKSLANQLGRNDVNENDARLAIKYANEKMTKIDLKEIEEAAKMKNKIGINTLNPIKDTASIQISAFELEASKPDKHLIAQPKLQAKDDNEDVILPSKMDIESKSEDITQSPEPKKKQKIDIIFANQNNFNH